MNRSRRNSDHVVAAVARLVAGTVAVLFGVLLIRSIPDLVRYVRVERM
jgi:hypothetical protein